ncbi:MAG: hypothetical protein JRN72_03995 [Nitrososphaerota archaeon]|jgi:predicted RNA-binding Zn-ribbon protein involved in translation (DUF1610 family)|nr:hypothetical protein [Nitrososphaerota archaeon]
MSAEVSYASPEVMALLRAISGGKATEFRPVFDPGRRGVTYPSAMALSGAPVEDVAGVLDFLANEDILVKEAAASYHGCSACGSRDLLFINRCASCGSRLIHSVEALNHLKCGHVDAASAFSTKKGLKCPKCGRELKAPGEDYKRISKIYKCVACGAGSPGAKGVFQCQACGASTPQEETSLDLVYSYLLNPLGAEKARAHAVDLAGVKGKLAGAGFSVVLGAKVRGRSGLYHEFALAAWRSAGAPGDMPPDLVADVKASTSPLPDGTLSDFMVKLTDCRVRAGVLAAVPGLSKEASELAEFYGIGLAICASLEEVPARVEELALKASASAPPPESAAPRAAAGDAGTAVHRTSADAVLLTLYEKQSQSYDVLKRLLEQVKASNSKLEELLGGPKREALAT